MLLFGCSGYFDTSVLYDSELNPQQDNQGGKLNGFAGHTDFFEYLVSGRISNSTDISYNIWLFWLGSILTGYQLVLIEI